MTEYVLIKNFKQSLSLTHSLSDVGVRSRLLEHIKSDSSQAKVGDTDWGQ